VATTLGFLAKSKPAGTSAVNLFTPGAQEVSVKVHCTNLGAVEVIINLYMDDAGGTTFDDTTVFAKDIKVPPNSKYVDYVLMNGVANDLGVKTSIGGAVNFMAEGILR